jgi:hypothetical protein
MAWVHSDPLALIAASIPSLAINTGDCIFAEVVWTPTAPAVRPSGVALLDAARELATEALAFILYRSARMREAFRRLVEQTPD